MAIWQFEFFIIPQGRKIEEYAKDDLISWDKIKIDLNIENYFKGVLDKKTSWSKNILLLGSDDKTCLELFIDNNNLQEIICKMDLRDMSNDLFLQILEFISDINGEIYYQDIVYSATLEVTSTLIKESNAAKFCINPLEYFKNINK